MLIGQAGSQPRRDYTQAEARPTGQTIVSKGYYLQPGRFASLSPDDASRFRPTAYVPPVQIDLMNRPPFLPFNDANPRDNEQVMPRDTFIYQRAANPPPGYAFVKTEAENKSSGFYRMISSGVPNTYQSEPYGLVQDGLVSPRNCPADKNCFINTVGSCQCEANSPYFLAEMRNVYN